MIPARTARALSAELSALTKKILRRALDDLNISAAQLAVSVGVSATIAEDWCRDESTRHVPLYLLAHPRVPQALRARIASDVLALAQESCAPQSRETATNLLLGVAGDAVAALARGAVREELRAATREGLRDRLREIQEGGVPDVRVLP